MAISEQLQNRIANLTGSMDPGFSVSPPPMSPEQQAMAKRMGEQFGVTPENMQPMTPEQKEYMGRMSVSPTDMMMRPGMQMPPQDMMQRGAVSDQEVGMYLDSATADMSEEDRQRLEMLLLNKAL
jgi:hypothetical protein